jgi:hypothetical protein
MNKTLNTLAKKVLNNVHGHYLSNDRGHQPNHAKEVMAEAKHLCHLAGFTLAERQAAVIGAGWHDAFADQRETHHQLAHDALMGDVVGYASEYGVTEEVIVLAARACLEHRASWKGGYTSRVSELVSAADRGKPTSLKRELVRAMKYGMDKLGRDEVEAKINACAHMHEKYGRNGYAVYPVLYRKFYGEELEDLWCQIDRLGISVDEFDRVVQ